MKWIKLLYAMSLSLLLFSGCTCIYPVLDYVDENNKSYIELFNEDGCKIEMKYLGTYPTYPDIHGNPVTEEIISHEQTYIFIDSSNRNVDGYTSSIEKCHIELKDEDNKIISFKSIELKSYLKNFNHYDKEESISKFKLDRGLYEIIYLYNDTSNIESAKFYIKLRLIIKGKIHIIEKSAFLKRKEGKVFFTPFCKIKF